MKSLLPSEVQALGAQAVLANTYHLYLRPGPEIIAAHGGLHRFMGWSGPMFTDSGGFQVFSLGAGLEHGIGKLGMFPDEEPDGRRRAGTGKSPARLMKVDDDGVSFRSHIDGSAHRLTPEISIQIQERLGPDIMLAFDEPTSPLHDERYTRRALFRTHKWADLCLAARTRDDMALYGIVQGGAFAAPRVQSAQFIGQRPFEGFAIGGSLGKTKADMARVLDWSVPELPRDRPRHMLGIGEPEDLFDCVRRGIDTFDCVSPTRLARRGVLYTPSGKMNVTRAPYRDDTGPLVDGCACEMCHTFSRAYLRHLFVAEELTAHTIASYHNLHYIVGLTARIREAVRLGCLDDLEREVLGERARVASAPA